jgi:hypothetical protein
MSLSTRSFAECSGAFWLVFGGCGSAVLAARAPASISVVGSPSLSVLTVIFWVTPLAGATFAVLTYGLLHFGGGALGRTARHQRFGATLTPVSITRIRQTRDDGRRHSDKSGRQKSWFPALIIKPALRTRRPMSL